MEISLKINSDQFKQSLETSGEKYAGALKTAANMIASMVQQQVTADIAGAGNFGASYVKALTVTVENTTIKLKLEAPGADIFEKGGTIHGKPLLWLPISGTDAVGTPASEYGDELFSVNRTIEGGVPLLFSIKDRAPKYFGVPSVKIPKKFHIAEIMNKIMDDFPAVYDTALKGGS